jgi:hypothetical protein
MNTNHSGSTGDGLSKIRHTQSSFSSSSEPEPVPVAPAVGPIGSPKITAFGNPQRHEDDWSRTPNTTGFPIIEVPLADPHDIEAVGEFLFDHGIYVTLAAYPLVPRDQVGFRVQLTAANGDDEIDQLNETITLLADRFAFQPAQP